MRLHHFIAPFAIAAASSAQAAGLPDLKKIIGSVDGEYLSYSGPFGSRRIVNAETRMDTGKTLVVLGISQGVRKASGDKFKATRLTASVTHDFNSRLSTRTTASIASNEPVFVTRELLQEVSYKPLPQTVVTAGGRYSRYWGGVDALSWSIGASQYFNGGMVSYRFSRYNVRNLGNTTGHLASLKVKDPYGSNQLWLGHGTALHDAVWLTEPEKGKFSNIEYRRVQPIGGGVGVMLGVSRTRYSTDSAKFNGTGARIGIVVEK